CRAGQRRRNDDADNFDRAQREEPDPEPVEPLDERGGETDRARILGDQEGRAGLRESPDAGRTEPALDEKRGPGLRAASASAAPPPRGPRGRASSPRSPSIAPASSAPGRGQSRRAEALRRNATSAAAERPAGQSAIFVGGRGERR